MAIPPRYPKPSSARPGRSVSGDTGDARSAPSDRHPFDYIILGLVSLGVFFFSYSFAQALRQAESQVEVAVAEASPADIDPRARVEGDIQTVYVDSAGGFDPQTLFAEADIPLTITFGQGGPCTEGVLFPDLGIFEDLTDGGAEIELPALEAGQYSFECDMRMLAGVIVVE